MLKKRLIFLGSCAAVVVSVAGHPGAASAIPPPGDHDCADFPTQSAAQNYFITSGYSSAYDPEDLDGDHDGVACESNPCPCSYPAPAPPPTVAPTPVVPPPPTTPPTTPPDPTAGALMLTLADARAGIPDEIYALIRTPHNLHRRACRRIDSVTVNCDADWYDRLYIWDGTWTAMRTDDTIIEYHFRGLRDARTCLAKHRVKFCDRHVKVP